MLTRRDLNRALLARQLLLERSPLGPLDALERLGGMPGQSPNPPYLGLWSRLSRFHQDDLTGLLESRAAVRVALMRSTVHLVSARDAVDLRPLVQPGQDEALQRTHGGRLGGVDLAELARETGRLVAEQPRTFAELGPLLAGRWPDVEPAALVAAARTVVPLVQVPPGGTWSAVGQPAYTSLEQWLGAEPKPSLGVDDLVLGYLSAFGPATVRDIEAWSGLSALREVTDRLGSELVDLRGEDGDRLLDLPDAPLPDEETPAPARFIAEFDNLLFGHADSYRLMTVDQRKAIFGTPGVTPGTVLVDGFVRGTWKITWHKGAATLVVRPFSQIPTKDVLDLTDEGERLLAFAADEATAHDVRFNSR